jgi:hypothetical protein
MLVEEGVQLEDSIQITKQLLNLKGSIVKEFRLSGSMSVSVKFRELLETLKPETISPLHQYLITTNGSCVNFIRFLRNMFYNMQTFCIVPSREFFGSPKIFSNSHRRFLNYLKVIYLHILLTWFSI